MKKLLKLMTLNLMVAVMAFALSLDSEAARKSKKKRVSKKKRTEKVYRAPASKRSAERKAVASKRRVSKKRRVARKKRRSKVMGQQKLETQEKMNANSVLARDESVEEEESFQRAPAGGSMSSGTKPLEIRGQTRNLNMLLVLKNKKEKIEFVHSREDYNGEILNTTPF
jgi:hypothetical protein